MSKINKKLLYLDEMFPIGKTELFLDNNDHSNYLGFTWQRTAVGKAIVGIDSSDSDFDTIGETGGSKTDDLSNAYAKFWITNNRIYWREVAASSKWQINYEGNDNDVHKNSGSLANLTAGLGLGGTVNKLQPYMVFAIWVRTA